MKGAYVQTPMEPLSDTTEKICTIENIKHASLTVDGYFAFCFIKGCDLTTITKITAINYATNQTIEMQHDTDKHPRLYYSKLNSYMAASPMFVKVEYSQYSFKGFVPISLHRTPCLTGGNIVAGVYEQTLYIYPKNFSIAKGSDQIYCDAYLEPHLLIREGETKLDCTYYEYYYACALSSSTVSSDIKIASIYDSSPITIKSGEVKSFTKLCFTDNQDNNVKSTYSFYASVYNKTNQTTLVLHHPYLSGTAPQAPSSDCLPVVHNCTYDGTPMNRFNYHWTTIYTGKKMSKGLLEPVTITCYINSTKRVDRTINNIPIDEKYLCFHSFVVAEKAMNNSVTSVDDMFTLSNMNIELTTFLMNIQDKEPGCTLLPNTYLKINTTIFQKNYTNYAFNYQMDKTGQGNASLMSLTNIKLNISNMYVLLPQYASDKAVGDITPDTYQGAPIFDFLSHITDNCYAIDQVRYYCVNNVLYVSTQNYCDPPKPPESINISLYDKDGPQNNLKLDNFKTVAGKNYIHNYTADNQNEVCTAKPYFSIDKYQYAGIYLFINEKFPIHIPVELTNNYCSLMDPAFDYQVQIFETALYFKGLCKLDDYCFEDSYSYANKPLELIGTTEDNSSPNQSPLYKYLVSSIIGSDLSYLIGLRRCSRLDVIKKDALEASDTGLSPPNDYYYLYFQSHMSNGIQWNNQTQHVILNYTRSCIEAPTYANTTWQVQLIDASTWGILVLSIPGSICSSNGIDVSITFFVVYTNPDSRTKTEQAIFTKPMTLVDTLSASHKYHINDKNMWSSYIDLRDKPDAVFYANLTFTYTFFTQEKHYVPISHVKEPCIVRTLTTRLLEIDYSASILETYNQENCYMLSDLVYLVLPATSSNDRAVTIEKNIKDIVVLEELLLNSFYSLEDVWAFINSTNVIDIAVTIEWNKSIVPQLQLKANHARAPDVWRRYSSKDFSPESPAASEVDITTMFSMRNSTIDVHMLAPLLYKYWSLTISTLPLVNITKEGGEGDSMTQTPLPATFKLPTVQVSMPDYDKFPTLTDQLKQDLNTDLSAKIITEQIKYNVSGLLNSKVISFSIGKTLFYNTTPLSFYQYNNFIMLVITLGNSDNKKSNKDTDILIMQSPIYTPFLLISDAFETQVEIVDDYLTIYCPSCILYDPVLRLTNFSLISFIARSNVQSLPVYLSTRTSVNAIRYNYSYTFRIGTHATVSDISFRFPVYDKNMTLAAQLIPNVCFLNGYMNAYLKSNKLFIIFELVNCTDIRPSSVFFTLTVKKKGKSQTGTQLGYPNKKLYNLNENDNWVSYVYIFDHDIDVNTTLLDELASSNNLEVTLKASISNTLVTRVIPVDKTSFSIEEQHWWLYLVTWSCLVIILSACSWVLVRAYNRRLIKKDIINLANYELSRSLSLYRQIEETFKKYINENGVEHPMLALHILLKRNWSTTDIAKECKTSPLIINRWKGSIKTFIENCEKSEMKRAQAFEKMKHKIMQEERRKNMKSKSLMLFSKKSKKKGKSLQTGSTENLLSTDSAIMRTRSQL